MDTQISDAQMADAQALLEKAAAQRAARKRKVTIQAKARAGNKFSHYWIPGHRLALGGEGVTLEATEQEIADFKKDIHLYVDDPEDEAQQASKAATAAMKLEQAKAAVAAAEAITASLPAISSAPPGVPSSAADALSELRASKKASK
jgi:hypothetical protein